jgi:hypothetical protein
MRYTFTQVAFIADEGIDLAAAAIRVQELINAHIDNVEVVFDLAGLEEQP